MTTSARPDITEALLTCTGAKNLRAVATALGVSQSTLSRQISGGSLSKEVILGICQAYDLGVIDLLLATGDITEGQAMRAAKRFAVQGLTDVELAEELMRRFKAGGDSARFFRTASSDEAIERERVRRSRTQPAESDVQHIMHDGRVIPLRGAAMERPDWKTDDDHTGDDQRDPRDDD